MGRRCVANTTTITLARTTWPPQAAVVAFALRQRLGRALCCPLVVLARAARTRQTRARRRSFAPTWLEFETFWKLPRLEFLLPVVRILCRRHSWPKQAGCPRDLGALGGGTVTTRDHDGCCRCKRSEKPPHESACATSVGGSAARASARRGPLSPRASSGNCILDQLLEPAVQPCGEAPGPHVQQPEGSDAKDTCWAWRGHTAAAGVDRRGIVRQRADYRRRARGARRVPRP